MGHPQFCYNLIYQSCAAHQQLFAVMMDGLKSLRDNSRIWEGRMAHRRSLGFARDDNLVWER